MSVAVAGCQASFKASTGGEATANNPPPPYNEPQQPGSAPRAAPMPGYYNPGTTTPPPNPGAPRYTLPGGETVPIITSPNVFGNGSSTSDALRGFVYTLPAGTQRLPDLSTLKPVGVVFTRTLDIPQRDFREGFPGIDNGRNEWFAIRYEGTFNVSKTAPYSFRLRTDDGSNLYIDDVKLIDNDGLHGAAGGAKIITLSAGTHRIRLDYFQGPGPSMALQVFTSEVDRPERSFTTSF
ncbi:PA14 domain-containing protein [Pendulispora albinea]|uniref:PA14 domain-containing protein n=1 Tax=Pendulispora albinea TaxID=2741071 RepID=A0ABZ2M9W7_9BACT